METKYFRAPLVLKDDQPGHVTAIFSTFGVVDRDGDIVEPTAFTHGQQVPMTWAHDWSMPVGRGTILVDAQKAIFDGTFFLDTQAGQEAYKTVKAMGDLQEWSWGFQVLDATYEQIDGEMVRRIKRTEVFEVSPVLVGAGIDTRTLAVKGMDAKGVAPRDVSTELAPEDTPWSAPNLSDFTDQSWNDLSDAEKRRIAGHFAWAAQMPPEAFGDLKLPHHRPSDGKVVWRGVAAAGAALMGARGGVNIPDADVPKVKAHLARHYRAFDKTPPWENTSGLTLEDEAETALAVVSSLTERVRDVQELRKKEGRAISTARREQMAKIVGQLRDAADALQAILDETAPPQTDGLALFVEFQKIISQHALLEG